MADAGLPAWYETLAAMGPDERQKRFVRAVRSLLDVPGRRFEKEAPPAGIDLAWFEGGDYAAAICLIGDADEVQWRARAFGEAVVKGEIRRRRAWIAIPGGYEKLQFEFMVGGTDSEVEVVDLLGGGLLSAQAGGLPKIRAEDAMNKALAREA